MITIESFIEQNATKYPDKTAVVCNQEECTYLALWEKINKRADELADANYQKGQIVCLRAYATIDYLVDYFAFHLIGCVVAP